MSLYTVSEDDTMANSFLQPLSVTYLVTSNEQGLEHIGLWKIRLWHLDKYLNHLMLLAVFLALGSVLRTLLNTSEMI